MGVYFSSEFWSSHAVLPQRSKLGDLPESCVALILSNLEPGDVCRLAKVNRTFRSASWADFVWESKLPRNYDVLYGKVLNGSCEDMGKREIYTRLCKANSLDDCTKRVWLDKRTSRVCLAISSKGLAITGIDDRRYWNYIPTEESRFGKVAYLQQTWWFEVEGEIEFPFPEGAYSVFFRLQLGQTTKRWGRRACNTEHVHGWDVKPVRFQLTTADGQSASSQCFLAEPGKWANYHVGDFTVRGTDASSKVKFSMTQIDCTHTKGGVSLDSLIIFPKEYKEWLKLF